MLVGTDVCIRTVFVWEEIGVPYGEQDKNIYLTVRYGKDCLLGPGVHEPVDTI